MLVYYTVWSRDTEKQISVWKSIRLLGTSYAFCFIDALFQKTPAQTGSQTRTVGDCWSRIFHSPDPDAVHDTQLTASKHRRWCIGFNVEIDSHTVKSKIKIKVYMFV